MSTNVTKSERVYVRYGTVGREDGGITFVAGNAQGGLPYLVLNRDTYEDMGEPEEITVTVEPGSVIQ
jgi:hypothetical protein